MPEILMALPLLAMGALPWVTFTIIACKCCREHALRANSRFVCRVLAAQILLFQGSQPPVITPSDSLDSLTGGKLSIRTGFKMELKHRMSNKQARAIGTRKGRTDACIYFLFIEN